MRAADEIGFAQEELEAWARYRDDCIGAGCNYERVEPFAWAKLNATLVRIHRRRSARETLAALEAA